MKRIALSGGIGSGKSTVAQYFAELGVPIIDTDQLSHACQQPNQAGYLAIVKHFGPSVLLENGEINRAQLREQVFNHPDKRRTLEQLLHPLILDQMEKNLAKLANTSIPYAIVVIPLLVEKQLMSRFDRVIIVDTSESQQKQRVLTRPGMNLTLLEQIMASQASRHERLAVATDIIHNDGDLSSLKRAVIDLDHLFRTEKSA